MTRDKRRVIKPGNEAYIDNLSLQNVNTSPVHYEICVQGLVSNQWFDCCDGLAFQVLEKDQTLIQANLADKSALHGLLARIGELNLTILSIKKIDESCKPGGIWSIR